MRLLRRSGAWTFLAACLSLASATELLGQSLRDDPDFFRPTTRHWSFDFSVSSVFDTNIDRDELERSSHGVASGFVARFRDRGRRHRFWVRYGAGAQLYAETDRWDGARSNLEATFERHLGSRLVLGGAGGHSLRVSSDDRELTHQYTVTPLVEYELTRDSRVLAYSTYRLRRSAEGRGDETIRSAGIEVATEIGDVSLIRVGYRYENADSERASRRYLRNTLLAGYDADFGRNTLRFELEYRERRYPDRLVEVAGSASRIDLRWIPSASWDRVFPGGHRLRLSYQYEGRTSNDPSKIFRGHRIELGLRVPLTGGVAVRRGREPISEPATAIEVDQLRLLSEHDEFGPSETQHFARGSDWKKVLQAQGVPSNISERPRFYEELWFYGDSWVVLKAGRVMSWHDTGNLKIAPVSPEEPTGSEEGLKPDQRRTIRTTRGTLTGAARQQDGDTSNATGEPSREGESLSSAVARLVPREIVLKDGTRFSGRLQKYEKGLAYIIITVGPKERNLLTTLPEHLIDKEATEGSKSP